MHLQFAYPTAFDNSALLTTKIQLVSLPYAVNTSRVWLQHFLTFTSLIASDREGTC